MVCLYQVFSEASMLGCGHTFCQQCIVSAMGEKRECPMCRAAQPPRKRYSASLSFSSDAGSARRVTGWRTFQGPIYRSGLQSTILKCTVSGERAAKLKPADGSKTRCCALKLSSAVRQQRTRQVAVLGWWGARAVTRVVRASVVVMPTARTSAGTETWLSMLLNAS